MMALVRVTQPTLDALEVLLQAWRDGSKVHGWAIMKATGRPGPTVYKIVDRLEDAGWIVGAWERKPVTDRAPRRRLYRLTTAGAAAAEELLAERRPGALQPFG